MAATGYARPAGNASAQEAAGRLTVLRRSYRGTAAQVGKARRDVAAALAGCPSVDAVLLCASEVMANAVRHSRSGMPGGHFTIAVDVRTGERVTVYVSDEGGAWRPAVFADDGELRGMGLGNIVAETAEMGIRRGRSGRTVWFTCDWTVAG